MGLADAPRCRTCPDPSSCSPCCSSAVYLQVPAGTQRRRRTRTWNGSEPPPAREREQRITALERRLARLKALSRGASRASPAGRLSPRFDAFESGLQGSVGATLGPPGLEYVETLGSSKADPHGPRSRYRSRYVYWKNGAVQRLEYSRAGAIERALTAPTTAPQPTFRSLGDTSTAAGRRQVLQEAGGLFDEGLDRWRGSFLRTDRRNGGGGQHQFMAALAGGCIGDAESRRYYWI